MTVLEVFTLVSQSLCPILGKYNFCLFKGLETKILLKEFKNFGMFGAKISVYVGSKMTKKAIFIPATSLPTQFSLKEKFLRAIVF